MPMSNDLNDGKTRSFCLIRWCYSFSFFLGFYQSERLCYDGGIGAWYVVHGDKAFGGNMVRWSLLHLVVAWVDRRTDGYSVPAFSLAMIPCNPTPTAVLILLDATWVVVDAVHGDRWSINVREYS